MPSVAAYTGVCRLAEVSSLISVKTERLSVFGPNLSKKTISSGFNDKNSRQSTVA